MTVTALLMNFSSASRGWHLRTLEVAVATIESADIAL